MSHRSRKSGRMLRTFECDSNNWQPTEGILKTPLPYWSFKLVPFPWVQVCRRWWSSAGLAHGLKGEFLICSWFGHVQVSKMMWDLCKKQARYGFRPRCFASVRNTAGSLAGLSTLVWMPRWWSYAGCDCVHQDALFGSQSLRLLGNLWGCFPWPQKMTAVALFSPSTSSKMTK